MYRIIVVEDSQIVRKGLIYTTDWESVGCEVVGEAENGVEGVALIERLRPDIVLTDIKMPGLDGVEMIEALIEQTEAFFIIMSAYAEFEYARKALRLGVVDYLMKPIEEDDLLKTLRETCQMIERNKSLQKMENQMIDGTESRLMLFREYFNDNTTTKEHYVQLAVDYIQAHFQKEITVKDLAEHLALSGSYLSRIFKEETGYTLVDYLTFVRMKEACKLLHNKSCKVYEVADQIGYNDQRYFSSMFKKYVGVTPKEFKEQLNKK